MAKFYTIFIIILKLFYITYSSNLNSNECVYTQKHRESDELLLSCYLLTNNFNLSLISNEHITNFNIICDFNSFLILSEKTFYKISKIKDLSLINCKLKIWNNNILTGLSELKNLTINTYNLNENILILQENSFKNVKLLEKLDLSLNNIQNIPEFLFCPLKNLVMLNLSYNSIVDILDLSFQIDDEIINDELSEIIVDKNAVKSKSNIQDFSCNLDLQILDLSHNHIKHFPSKSLNSLKRLRILNLNNNDLTLISSSALKGLKVLRTIDLSNNRLLTLPSLLFKNLIELREVKLHNNSLENLSNDIFNGLEQLLILNLSKNRITSSTLNLFKGLIRLVLLDLSFNRITNLNPNYFSDLYTLQILNLEHNYIELLPTDAFAPMKNLHTLILSYNKLAILEPFSFNGLFALSLLSLDHNQIHTLHYDSLRNCSSLQDLNLNDNMLRDVPLALQNMRLLRTVDLGENMIEHLNPGFLGMNNLYGLRLHGNQIKNFTSEIFSKLYSLQILNLARNKINTIEKGSFNHNYNLQAIRLDSNLIFNISGLFNNLPNLIWLNISDNLLIKFNYSDIPQHLQWLDLHKNKINEIFNENNLTFSKLQTLDISYNKLKLLSSNIIPNSIEFILLNDNLISKIELNTFINKPNLTRVDLYSNKLIKMNLNSLLLSPINDNKNLPEFYIGSNPFYCDCSMDWLQRINTFTHLRQYPKVMDLESIYCKLPYSREQIFVPLSETEVSNFVCAYSTHCFALCHCCDFDACDCKMQCPLNCTCYHDQTWSVANIVDCSNSNFDLLPHKIPMDATELYLDGNNLNKLTSHSFIGRKNLKKLYLNNSNIINIHNNTFRSLKKLEILHLEYNFLKEIQGYELQYLENIREIYLQYNQIIHINNNIFTELKNLEILRLDGNRLFNFPVWNLPLNLIKIRLSENNWSCNCQFIRDFRNWLKNNIIKVIDSDKLTCINRYDDSKSIIGTYISDFNSTVCSSYLIGVGYFNSNFHKYTHDYFLLLLAIVIAFIFAICIIFIVACQKRKCLKCKLKICKSCKKTSVLEDIETARLFDVYIIYSLKDREFVNQILAPGLEPQYRLRLHYRDFTIGSYLTEIVQDGIDNSNKTLLVLSQSFLASEWQRYELKSAFQDCFHRDVQQKRDKNVKRLIIITYGEIPQRDLDPDIRVYLNKMAVCLKWGDSRFWEKLRFAMPEIRTRIPTTLGDKEAIKGSLYYCCKQTDDPSSSSGATSSRSDTEYSAISTLPDLDTTTRVNLGHMTRSLRVNTLHKNIWQQ